MLIHWQSHQEYLYFLHETKVHLDSSQRTRLRLEYAAVRDKLRLLDLDPVMRYLSQFYSTLGRPAQNQTQIIRSLILMMMLDFTGLTAWVRKLNADSLLAVLVGCPADSLPPLGSYFDFMDRLWPQGKASQRTGRRDLFPKDKNAKPSKKPGKGKKLPNKHSGITDTMAAYALEHDEFPFHFEARLQQVFRLAAILPSRKDGLIPQDGLTLSGDGTCVHSHSSPYGHKVCKCMENGITGCSCKRHFSDPDARWGWDSDEEVYYFGHTLYMLCTMHRPVLTCPCISDSWMPDGTTASAPSSPSGNSGQSTRIFPSGIFVWTPPMTTMPPTGCATSGKSGPLSTSTVTVAAPIPSRTPSPLTKTAPRCVWQASVWSTGDTADRSIPANGAARWPAAGWIPAHAQEHALPLLTAVVSIQNRTGTSVSTPLFQEGQKNIRRFTITALPAKG